MSREERIMKKRSRRNRPLSGNVTRIGGRLAAAVAVASLVGGGVLVGTESAAVAGTSGQEIEFDTYTVNSADALSHVEIAGYNQNGNGAVWKGTSSNGFSITTTGWWWAGNVTVTWTEFGVQHSLVAYVPRSTPAAGDVGTYDYWPDITRITSTVDNNEIWGSWNLSWSMTAQNAPLQHAIPTSTGYNDPGCLGEDDPLGKYTVWTIWLGWYGSGTPGQVDGYSVPSVKVGAWSYDYCDDDD
jgi:hypothetical protein